MLKTAGLIVRTRVEFVGRTEDGKIFFIGRSNCGTPTLFHQDYYFHPVLDGDSIIPAGNDEIVPGIPDDLSDIGIGTILRGVCEHGPKGPRAVWWCFASDYVACEEELAHNLRIAEEERRLVAFERAAANPRTVDEALEFGWVVVPGGNGRQRILERQFAGEPRPRRITRHLPSQQAPVLRRRQLSLAS
ncbi:MAG: hypothetical protein AAB677_02505 [Patescibacteria group bacterium]